MQVFKYQLTDNQTGYAVFEIGSFDNHDEFRELAQTNYYTMLLVEKGKGQVVRDDALYEFSSPCLLCFSLYQPFKIMPEGEFEGAEIRFQPAFFCLISHRDEVSCNGVLFNNLYDTPFVGLLQAQINTLQIVAEEITSEINRHEKPDHDVIISYLKIFLINASRAKLTQQKGDFSVIERANPMAVTLRNAIEEHFRTRHSPADYAELLYVSTPVLNNLSRQYFNKTLTNLIADRMATEAKRELYLTAKPVKQIAFELGYGDEFYFSRFFKKHTGVSPALFRNNVRFDKLQLY
jgi:AraC family transcriptional regulator, transcriptional activator of pobA